MADNTNIIKRVIQMLLDKDSAKKVQSDANSMADSVDKSWKSTATKIGGYLAAAFGLNAIKNFGIEAVKQAMASEATWKQLAGTIEATGESFAGLEDQIHKTADAFKDATVHDDDEFAEGLMRMISLTGDVKASLNNMGLVANVAAQFFKGDLAPATELVSKVMNGNVNMLQRMGIHVTSAQQGLEVLATRSMGAAERETQTFSGQLKQMNVEWDDFVKALGNAIIHSDGGTDSINVLRSAIEVLTNFVNANKDAITEWVTGGIKFAIDASDVLIRTTMALGDAFAGGFLAALGLASVALGKLMEGYGHLREIEDDIREKLGQDVTERKKFTATVLENAKALQEFGKEKFNSGVDQISKIPNILSNSLFSSADFAGPRKPKAALPVNAPMVGKNVSTDDTKAIEDAMKTYREEGKAIAAMQQVLGNSFDATNAEIDREQKLLVALAQHGTTPAAQGLDGLNEQFGYLKDLTGPVNIALVELNKSLGADMAKAVATGETATEALTAQISDVEKAIDAISKTPKAEGAAETVAALIEQLKGLKLQLKDAKDADDFTQALKDMGDTMRQDLFTNSIDSTDALTKLKQKQDALHQAILVGIKDHKTDTQSFKELKKQYEETTDAIKEQTLAMQAQTAAADFLADALGTALAGGLHEAAVAKAKQNAIESAEMLVRAGAFALFGDGAHAGAALALAAQFAGVAAAWGILAAATGGGGGGSAAPAVASASSASASSGGDDVSSSRQTSSQSAQNAQPMGAEVSLYLVGPGFDMLNPKLQRVVYGAQQQAVERYGDDARIRVVPNGVS